MLQNYATRLAEEQKQIVLQNNDLGISTLATWVSSGTIDVSPDFQRRDRWNDNKRSSLIESLLLGLPIPPVYLAEESTGRYVVIDGRQRLTAIQAFLSDNLVLKGLQTLEELNGLKYSELPTGVDTNLGMRPLRTVTLLNQTAKEAKYQVFQRLNTGGEALEPQEIRNSAFRGPFNDLLIQLSENPFLKAQMKIKDQKSPLYRKMGDVEMVLRFFALFEDPEHFRGDIASTLDSYMSVNKDPSPAELEDFKLLFEETISEVERLFGFHAFHRPEKDGWRDQFLAGLYDAEMIAVAQLRKTQATNNLPELEGQKIVRELFKNEDFEASVRTATNTPSRLRRRITLLREALKASA